MAGATRYWLRLRVTVISQHHLTGIQRGEYEYQKSLCRKKTNGNFPKGSGPSFDQVYSSGAEVGARQRGGDQMAVLNAWKITQTRIST